MKILVTGAAGFIGSHLVDRLISLNEYVIGIDNFDPFYDKKIKLSNCAGFVNSPCYIHYDINIFEQKLLEEIFSKHKIDVVIHLAAKAGVRPSIADPTGYYNTNVIGTLNILEVMKKNGVKKMIFASSSSVYGNNNKTPFSETDTVDNPISPYAASKKAGELLCHTYHHLYDFDIYALRFFTVYGPRQRPDLAIHKFSRLIRERKPIPFYGDGSSGRDYTFIDDIIDGIIAALERLKGFEVFNIGESKIILLSQMISVLESALGKKAILERLPLQPGDVQLTYADISKARKMLNYQPKINFEDGIDEFVRWFMSITKINLL